MIILLTWTNEAFLLKVSFHASPFDLLWFTATVANSTNRADVFLLGE